MKHWLREAVEETEKEWARPFSERLFKVLFVGAAAVITSWAAEKSYDRYTIGRREKQAVEEDQ